MIEDGEKRHYIAIKNMSRLLSKLNGKTQHAYHYCINCLNRFRTASARDKHYEFCSNNGHAKVNVPTDGQYQFKVPFTLYADFERILKPVDERYKDNMNRMKAGRKGKGIIHEKNKHKCTVRMVCTQHLCLRRCS